MIKKLLLGLVVLLLVVGAGGFVFFKLQVRAWDQSMAKHYDFPVPTVELSNDALVLARGKHLVESIGACTACHGDNLGGGRVEEMGPLGRVVHRNITPFALKEYSDGELVRLLRHGIKRDGTTLRMMPVQEMSWWPDADRIAVVSYLRVVQPVAGQPGAFEVTDFLKFLDRLDAVPFDIARRVDHEAAPSNVSPAETAEYGKQLAIACRGCHGDKHFAGGKIPGTPPEVPIPLNLTPHETGLKGWTYEDFAQVVKTGKRKNGQSLNAFMPVAALRNYNETELKALWAYLASLPPVAFGER